MIPLAAIAAVAMQVLKGPVADIIDKHIADQQSRDKLKAELQQGLVTALGQQADAQAGVIKAEAESEHWLTANWRPILMLVLMGFLVWIGIILPLIDLAVGAPIPYQPRWNQLPAEFWNFLGIGMGGYIGGRSLEKVATQVIAARQK